jgi:hypothetical protein
MIEDGTFYTGKLLRGLLFICTLQRYNVPWSLAVFLFLSWPIVIFLRLGEIVAICGQLHKTLFNSYYHFYDLML